MKVTRVRPMRCEVAEEGILEIDHVGAGVGVVFYNRTRKIGIGIHVLRANAQGAVVHNPANYADTGIKYALEQLDRMGARADLSVAIAGGAGMLTGSERGRIGAQTAKTVKQLLEQAGIAIKREELGGTKVRSIFLNVDEGKIKIA